MIDIRFMIQDGGQLREVCGSFDAGATVLDALETLRNGGQSPVPAYRHSCHHGSCGTCGAIINGLEALMCLTRLGELAAPRPRVPGGPKIGVEQMADGSVIVRLEPIRGGSLVAGIASRPTQALVDIPAELPYLMTLEAGKISDRADGKVDAKVDAKADLPGDPTRPGPKGEADLDPPASSGPPRRVRFEACIECGLCSSSCPVAAPFIGPAALAALNRQRQKRPETSESMLALAGTPEGAIACERHLACSRVCPQGVHPGKHIQLLKNALGARP